MSKATINRIILLEKKLSPDTAGQLPICPPGMSYKEFCDLYANEFL